MLRVEPDKDRGVVGAITVASLFAGIIAVARWASGEPPFETDEAVFYTVLAGVFEAIYFMTLARALEAGPLGAVYTISRGGAVLVVWPLSIVLFTETLTWTSGTGSAVVLGGLILAGVGAHGASGGKAKAGVSWAIACAVSIAG